MISKRSMRRNGGEQLTLLPEDSPANRSVVPGSKKARRMTVISGLKCSALLQSASPVGCLVRMCLGSSVWNSTAVLLTWRGLVMKSGRQLFRLVPWGRRISAHESGLWPTPKSNEVEETPEELEARVENFKQGKTKFNPGVPLNVAVKMWPTPRSSPNENRQTKPTPSQLAGEHGMNLATAVMFPTPRGNKTEGYSSEGFKPTLAMIATGEAKPLHGQLNPTWVEWLMGFPIGWTDCDFSVTRSSRKSRRKSSGQ